MTCLYDLEGAQLYSLKWYKNGREFFRIMPTRSSLSADPQIFPVPGVRVDPLRSDQHQLSLYNITRQSAGRFRCEVTESGLFLTAVHSVEVRVSSLPLGPEILGVKASYSVEEKISAECSTTRSLPEPELSWYVNGNNIDRGHVLVINHHQNNTHHGLIDSVSMLEMSDLKKYCKVFSPYK